MSTGSNAVAVIDRDEPMELRPMPPGTAAIRPPIGLPTPQEMQALQSYGEMIAASKLFPKVTTWQAAVVIIQFGQQLGIDPFTALKDIDWIDGKPAVNASLINTLIKRDHGGEALIPVESTRQRCTISFKRRDWTERQEMTATLDDFPAKLREKDNWRNYPGDMLWARLVSQIGRRHFTDTIKGVYTADELVEARYIEAQARVIERPTPTPAMATSEPDVETTTPIVASSPASDRKSEAKALAKAVETAFGLHNQSVKMVTDTAEDLVCWRFGYQESKAASAEDLAEVRAGIEGWQRANWVSQGIHWLEQVGAVEHEDSAIQTGLLLDEAQVDDPFVHAALADRLAEFERAAAEQLATVDAAVDAAVQV